MIEYWYSRYTFYDKRKQKDNFLSLILMDNQKEKAHHMFYFLPSKGSSPKMLYKQYCFRSSEC